MTQEELEACIGHWQERLRLRDWRIVAKVKRAWEMDTDETGGEIVVQENSRIAFLTLRDPVDLNPEYAHLNDAETIVCHEMLHILTKPLGIPGAGPKKVAEEQLIHAVAEALVALKREQEEFIDKYQVNINASAAREREANERADRFFKAAETEQKERLRLEEEAVKQHKERVALQMKALDREGRA